MNQFKSDFKVLPKADIHNHLHLGGKQNKLKERYPNSTISFPKSYKGLPGMIDFIYKHLNTIMLTQKDVINFMEIAIESAIEDNVTLLEASVDLGLVRLLNDDVENLIAIVSNLKEKYSAQIDFKPDLGINKDLELEIVYFDGLKCLESAVFSGIDLYGQEVGKNLKPFVRLYDMANTSGIKTKVHIGEFSNHLSIENAIKLLKPREIQHGIRAVDAITTMDMILENDIRLNICPTSNIALGAVDNMKAHPMRTLFDHGIKITINTDDIILFDATLSDEFNHLAELNLFTAAELEEIRMNAFITS